MWALVVRFELRDEQATRGFDALVAETLPQIIATEPGTLVYAVHEVADAPLSRVFYEVYADKAAFEVHEEQAHTRRFLAERSQYLTDFRVEFLSSLTGKGV
ncbi:putative quinol monooxygenase [Actinokineospora diospyrosa]|uniref:Quinol monooxygenase YgiN n=1 Tax=Actinokineospora diospyrosa TaxID=103728 RepID=A0ABT1IP45_9PSEU|nr:antibiotic biosynthesis monooxygenase [Actinokineospora diospyrosa]MCP2274448.1 Quinol monooxygenase YgiN [Actinokineospora diospyrosa]